MKFEQVGVKKKRLGEIRQATDGGKRRERHEVVGCEQWREMLLHAPQK